MRQTALRYVLPLSLLLCPLAASADPARLNNPAPPPVAPVAPPPPSYDAPPPVGGYSAPPPVGGYNAPPPVAGYNAPPPMVQGRQQPVMVSQQPMLLRQPAPRPASRQGLFVGVQGGAVIPVAGDYASGLSTGFMGLGHIGWATISGISVRAELGVRSNAMSDSSVATSARSSVFYGAGLRWTGPRATLRPYAEVLVDAFSALAQTSDGTATTASAGTGVSVGGAIGAEIEVSETFSLEVAARYDHIVVNGTGTAGLGGLLGILGGGTFYF